MQAPALTTWPWGPALFPRVSVNYPGQLWPGPGHEWGLRGQSGIRMLEPGVCEPSIVLQAANFSLGPGISSNISNNLWWWNILQWGSAGDPVLGDTGDISASQLQITWYRVLVSPQDWGPRSGQNTQIYFGFYVKEFLNYGWGCSETKCWWLQGSISISEIPTVQIIK